MSTYLDRVYDEIERAMERGEITEQEARADWFGAVQEERERYGDE